MGTRELIQEFMWIVVSIGGLVAAFRGIHEVLLNRRQRQREHRWRQAEVAKTLLDEIWSNDASQAAMLMLDWTNREYEIEPGVTVRIVVEDVVGALRTEDISFDLKEAYIRDCFDEFLDGLQRLEHYIDIDLIHFEDVEYPVAYYVEELTNLREPVERYLKKYDFTKTGAFLNRFEFWKNREDRGREPCFMLDRAKATDS